MSRLKSSFATTTRDSISTWRTGMSKAMAVPDIKTMIPNIQTWITLTSTRTPNNRARSMRAVWVMNNSLSLGSVETR